MINIFVIFFFNLEKSFRGSCCLKKFLIWQPFQCSVVWNNLCNFGRGHYEEHFCEIILTFEKDDFEKKISRRQKA